MKPTAITIGCVVEALVINKQGEEAWQLVQDWKDMPYPFSVLVVRRCRLEVSQRVCFLMQFASVVNLCCK